MLVFFRSVRVNLAGSIGSGSIILRGVTIGENAIVTAGAVIDKDVPDCSLAQGNPMKIITDYSALM